MSKLKLFIVEDDEEALERLIALLQRYGDIINLDALVIARSFAEAQNCIIETKGFDVSILDKNLDEGETCFSLITEKNIQKFGLRVFNTIERNDEELLKKLQISSGHLVLGKPYTVKSVATLMSEITEKNVAQHKPGDYLTVKIKNDYKYLLKEFILAIVINNNLATIHYKDEDGDVPKFTETGQMEKYLLELGLESFQLIRQATLINIKSIAKVNKQERTLYLKGVTEPFTVAESYIESLRQRGLWP